VPVVYSPPAWIVASTLRQQPPQRIVFVASRHPKVAELPGSQQAAAGGKLR
jgi:hypothetical protein